MISTVGRRVAVVNWWATWPAEPINGVIVSDRSLTKLKGRVFPQDWVAEYERLLEEVDQSSKVNLEEGDLAAAQAARALAGQDFDLALFYFRSIDNMQHFYWKYYRPEQYPDIDQEDKEIYGDRIPLAYEAIDHVIGEILDTTGSDTNIFVVSDHGVFGLPREEVRIDFDLDQVLAKLGYLTFSGNAVDFRRTKVFTYSTPRYRPIKKVRFAAAGREPNGTVRLEERPHIRSKLESELAKIRYTSGEPVFRVRQSKNSPKEVEADFIVEVLSQRPTPEILINGEPMKEAVRRISRISGTHNRHTHGIFIAAGPDINPGAMVDGIRVHDITPTLLFGLGLPVAEDFAGKAQVDLFTAEFSKRHPLHTISSWGDRQSPGVRASEEDERILEELRALGYIR
jgi:predicted AlkP superfamily phosphohydrolase/phosphomutase